MDRVALNKNNTSCEQRKELQAYENCCTSIGYSLTCDSLFLLTVDGNWTQWSHWSACSLSCGGGTRSRTRTCTDPPPSNNGKTCAGEGSEQQGCNTQSCPGR